MIELTLIERRALRATAHHLQPVVAISQHGLTAAVLKEIDVSLKAHELIKVKLHGIERDARDTLLATLCADLQCAPVQHIGNIFVLWRKNPEKEAATAPKPRRKPVPRTKKQAAAALEKPRRSRSR
ncbi:MAG: YhbY family RNA-binding protein [Gammaproteobacteria bacterium]|nr:YhbY family RNA-binding protein [Rhodocyclaceae bacterium]MBU3908551.1 YhbY family RNA-binding protein [Gammaproteobacteria bacterium]MBU3990303.1 YhbY family RNA-binding protein [Gammaproteobacteria bacterium]MBU4004579.1 YhbY family RNA-binding protein [Gammaproteobacteria bacterium]MBU4021182.1 YhbY family RNA-binding protein [Gammaproteobacteria bacterium]